MAMTKSPILANISRHIHLDAEETRLFESFLQSREISQKEFLLKEGQACKTISYVHSGALRAYCVDKKGRESTIMFALSDWWVTDMYCFTNRLPAMMYIEALQDSTVFQITRDGLDELLGRMEKFERLFRILFQNAYTREQLRIIENLTLPAEERYIRFLSKYPEVVQQVPQKQIASYLGITPEFLSTIRKNRSRGPIS
jgi:CRP-like cAMP-binding protein